MLENRSRLRENLKILADLLYNIAIIVVIVAVVRYTLISPFQVNGSSMIPNLQNAEFLMVDKLSYYLHEPQRGDIIVLIPPPDTDLYYVKRIIGLPGEKIEFLDGQVIIHNDAHPEGKKLDEPYLSAENEKTYWPTHENKIIDIPPENYFVMGDNRRASNDSRSWGILNRHNIEGRAWFVFLPLNGIRLLSHQDYTNT
ncbi:MAG: signal peptidase I [Candidatus Abawacabacteria bacterium]|nr:signal peptidase I [Candidatus Abawacabacteria bacterium]